VSSTAPEDTGRFSNSELLSFFQIAVSGSGRSLEAVPGAVSAAKPALEEASAAQNRNRESMVCIKLLLVFLAF
jgi:hypothetical protein